jgi:hypothetical protein
MVRVRKTVGENKPLDYFKPGDVVYFTNKIYNCNQELVVIQVKVGVIAHVNIGEAGTVPLYHVVGQGFSFDKSATNLYRDYETAFITAVAERK